jgi:hypothetical protein
MVIYSFLPSLF